MWLKSFLTGRNEFTVIKNKSFCKPPITNGVAQESVLGPLLLLLYTKYLHKTIQHSSVCHIANETNLFYTTKRLKAVLLIPWSIENNLIYLFITPSQTGLNQKHRFS